MTEVRVPVQVTALRGGGSNCARPPFLNSPATNTHFFFPASRWSLMTMCAWNAIHAAPQQRDAIVVACNITKDARRCRQIHARTVRLMMQP